jgi:UDP-N-acetylmuramoyl-L-alanyl-D-glutamate--2,6-diaminopimelate ligase
VVSETLKIDDLEIQGLAYDSRKVKPGDVFVAIPGLKFDGYDFIPQAIDKGAKVIITEKDLSPLQGINVIKVDNARRALAELSCRFYDYPSRKLKLIGVTGTNGKTSTAYFIESMLRESGFKVGMIGTVETKIAGKSIPSTMTTPESLELQYLLAQMVKEGVTHVVMEVSSHALAQERVRGMEFDIAIFTNLTHEHLDYHKTIKEYLESKKKLFQMLKPSGIALINVDDPYSKQIAEAVEGEISFYGLKDLKHELRSTKQSEFDVRVKEYDIRLEGMRLRLDSTEIRTPYTGIYNIYNILAAFQCGLVLLLDRKKIKNGIEKAYIPGRFERIECGTDFSVIVDFAHTPDGLQKLLETVKPLAKGRIILVFGCPGDRDKEKRPIMGEIASRLADQVIVTTDDPHSEEPQAIINEILQGITRYSLLAVPAGRQVTHYVDRREAIEKALSMARKGDIVVIAGRGHEKYQDFNGKKAELDDREVVRKFLTPPHFVRHPSP